MPRFLVLEVLLFFHFLQQSHAALNCFTAQTQLNTSNGTSLTKEEKGPKHHRAVPLEVIVKTDRVSRSTVTISVKPSSVLDGADAVNDRDVHGCAKKLQPPLRCLSKYYYPQTEPSFPSATASTDPLSQCHSGPVASTAKSYHCHGRGLPWHQGGHTKNLSPNSLLHSPDIGRKTDDSAVLIISPPVQRLLLFAPKYF